ncbi:hypothetical protein FOA52_004664 [Chlamydomonas sp. UWO 241]|nr:hypothetical protein FOA52_004664 [Chlamydomonas sp. UWO 241]
MVTPHRGGVLPKLDLSGGHDAESARSPTNQARIRRFLESQPDSVHAGGPQDGPWATDSPTHQLEQGASLIGTSAMPSLSPAGKSAKRAPAASRNAAATRKGAPPMGALAGTRHHTTAAQPHGSTSSAPPYPRGKVNVAAAAAAVAWGPKQSGHSGPVQASHSPMRAGGPTAAAASGAITAAVGAAAARHAAARGAAAGGSGGAWRAKGAASTSASDWDLLMGAAGQQRYAGKGGRGQGQGRAAAAGAAAASAYGTPAQQRQQQRQAQQQTSKRVRSAAGGDTADAGAWASDGSGGGGGSEHLGAMGGGSGAQHGGPFDLSDGGAAFADVEAELRKSRAAGAARVVRLPELSHLPAELQQQGELGASPRPSWQAQLASLQAAQVAEVAAIEAKQAEKAARRAAEAVGSQVAAEAASAAAETTGIRAAGEGAEGAVGAEEEAAGGGVGGTAAGGHVGVTAAAAEAAAAAGDELRGFSGGRPGSSGGSGGDGALVARLGGAGSGSGSGITPMLPPRSPAHLLAQASAAAQAAGAAAAAAAAAAAQEGVASPAPGHVPPMGDAPERRATGSGITSTSRPSSSSRPRNLPPLGATDGQGQGTSPHHLGDAGEARIEGSGTGAVSAAADATAAGGEAGGGGACGGSAARHAVIAAGTVLHSAFSAASTATAAPMEQQRSASVADSAAQADLGPQSTAHAHAEVVGAGDACARSSEWSQAGGSAGVGADGMGSDEPGDAGSQRESSGMGEEGSEGDEGADGWQLRALATPPTKQQSVKTPGIGYTVVRSVNVWEPGEAADSARRAQLAALEEERAAGAASGHRTRDGSRAGKALVKAQEHGHTTSLLDLSARGGGAGGGGANLSTPTAARLRAAPTASAQPLPQLLPQAKSARGASAARPVTQQQAARPSYRSDEFVTASGTAADVQDMWKGE